MNEISWDKEETSLAWGGIAVPDFKGPTTANKILGAS